LRQRERLKGEPGASLRLRGCASLRLVLSLILVGLAASPARAATNSTRDRNYIVEHNLFSPDRRFTPETKKAESKAATGNIKLVGVIMVGDLKEAVISIKGANPPVMILKEGEEANGCKVLTVNATEVVVERNGKRETLVFEEDKTPYETQTASKNPEKAPQKRPKEPAPPPPPEESKPSPKENPFFKILESVRKNAGKRGEKGPPPIFPFH